jgi:hypothetical protein
MMCPGGLIQRARNDGRLFVVGEGLEAVLVAKFVFAGDFEV